MKKSDNRGFTIIELIISVAILALVVIPIMYSFAMAANTNKKARVMQDATTYAQSISEEFKTFNIEELEGKYAATLNYDGSYTFTLSNDNYNASVNLNPTKYTGESNNLINEYEIPEISQVNSELDAVLSNEIYRYNESAVYDLYVDWIVYFSNMYPAEYDGWMNGEDGISESIVPSREKVEDDAVRTITVDIAEDSDKYSVKVTANYTYASFSQEYVIYTKTFDNMPRIYLYYTPFSYTNTVIDDVIDISNKSEVNVEVYIAMQEDNMIVNSMTFPNIHISEQVELHNTNDNTYIKNASEKNRLYSMDISVVFKEDNKEYANISTTKEE